MDEKKEERKPKATKLVLDDVEMGADEQPPESGEKKGKRQKIKLPEGITYGMMLGDVVRIAMPAFIELLLAQLVSMADTMMVGQIAPYAISAVGVSGNPILLLQMVMIALNVGTTALVSRYKGEGDMHKANSVMRHALLLTAGLAVIFAAAGYALSGPMVRFMGVTDKLTFDAAVEYMQIRFIGFLPLMLPAAVTAALRGVGDSRTAMYYNLAANVVNVIFNYLMIYGNFGFPRMEVAGAAWATDIGSVVACIMSLVVLLRGKKYLWLNLKEKFKFDGVIIKNFLIIGLPAMFEQFVVRVGLIIYTRIAVSLGTIQYATHQVCINIGGLSFMPGQAITAAVTSLTGQCLGKKRIDMAVGYNRCSQVSALCVGLVCFVIFFFFGAPIVRLYSPDERVISLGKQVLRLIALYQPFQSMQYALSGALQGSGDTRASAIIMCVTVMIIRPVFAHLAVNVLDLALMGAWYAMAADWIIRCILTFFRYSSGKWKHIKLKT